MRVLNRRMGLRVLRQNMHVAMSWKDGGGTTFEVASEPPGAAINAFDWRVSFARVGGSGPFSCFPGVDRVITLVEGEKLVLSRDGVGIALQPFTPFAFAGEDEVTCAVLAPIIDFNVMTRRGRYEASVTVHRLEDETIEVEPEATGDSLVAVLEGRVTSCTASGVCADLAALDVVTGFCAPITVAGTARVAVVSVRAASGL